MEDPTRDQDPGSRGVSGYGGVTDGEADARVRSPANEPVAANIPEMGLGTALNLHSGSVPRPPNPAHTTTWVSAARCPCLGVKSRSNREDPGSHRLPPRDLIIQLQLHREPGREPSVHTGVLSPRGSEPSGTWL